MSSPEYHPQYHGNRFIGGILLFTYQQFKKVCFFVSNTNSVDLTMCVCVSEICGDTFNKFHVRKLWDLIFLTNFNDFKN